MAIDARQRDFESAMCEGISEQHDKCKIMVGNMQDSLQKHRNLVDELVNSGFQQDIKTGKGCAYKSSHHLKRNESSTSDCLNDSRSNPRTTYVRVSETIGVDVSDRKYFA